MDNMNQPDIRESLKEIGARIKNIRIELRINQKEMAENLNIANTYLSEIESGKRNPGYIFFYKLYKTFNINLNYLFTGEGEMLYPAKPEKHRQGKTFVEDIKTIDDLVWYMKHSQMFFHQVMGFAFKFKFDNEESIKKEIEKSLSEKDE